MTDQVPEGERESREENPAEPETPPMPGWVPVLIGAVLVALAGLAVFTGLRYHDEDTITAHVAPQRGDRAAPAPPGEPGAGASLIMHGTAGDTTPEANAPVQGSARAVITGGRGGISATMRIWARRGMVVHVQPEDAMIYVNDVAIGQANQFASPDEAYEFAEPGSYNVKITASGYRDRLFVVTAADEAKEDLATIDVKLEKE